MAESSVTIPDISYVIDFCLTKQLKCDLSTNYAALQLQWADKNSCEQRKGRGNDEFEIWLLWTFLRSDLPIKFQPDVLKMVEFFVWSISSFMKLIVQLNTSQKWEELH